MDPNSSTMSSSSLFHTYNRYVAATEAVIQWLCFNAESCSPQKYSAEPSVRIESRTNTKPITKKQAKKTAKKNKKKSKGRAKEQVKNEVPDDEESKKPALKEVHVPITEYIILVRSFASSSETQIHIPFWVFCHLHDMISIRKMFVDRAESWGAKNDVASDIPEEFSSQALIFELEEVIQLLSSWKSKDDLNLPAYLWETPDASDDYNSGHPYENLFPDETIRAGQEWQKESVSQNFIFRPSKTEEENILMVQCLFEDFYATRKFLRQSWEAYSRQETDLYAVSVLTNTALDFLISAVDEVGTLLDKKALDYEDFLPLAAQWIDAPVNIFDPFLKEYDNQIHEFVWPIAETICLPAYSILKRFLNDPKNRYTSSELSVDRPVETGIGPLARYTQAKHILNYFLGEVWIMFEGVLRGYHAPSPDNLTRGIRKMIGDNKIPPWLPLGLTIYLDIYQALGTKLEMGHSDLLLGCYRLHQTIDDFWRSAKSLKPIPRHIKQPEEQQQQAGSYNRSDHDCNNYHSCENEMVVDDHASKLWNLMGELLWVEEDALNYGRLGYLIEMGFHNPKYRSFNLMKIHPLFCGILDFQFTLRMQQASIQAANDWGAIASMAYLYSTCHVETWGNYFKRWRDMETLLWLFKDQFGENPKNAEEMLSRFEQTTGFQAANFGEPLPQGVQPTELLKPRTNRLVDIFSNVHCTISNGGNVDLSTFQRVWDLRVRVLTPRRLYVQLALYLKFDFFALKFNYLSMHMQCMRMLLALHMRLDDKLVERFGTGYIERTNHLPFLCGYILTDLCKHSSVGRMRDHTHRRQQESDSASSAATDEYYLYEEPVSGNNEVYEYESKQRTDKFKDYDLRDHNCPVTLPYLLFEAGNTIDEIVENEGSREHIALESIKDPPSRDLDVLRGTVTTQQEAEDLFCAYYD